MRSHLFQLVSSLKRETHLFQLASSLKTRISTFPTRPSSLDFETRRTSLSLLHLFRSHFFPFLKKGPTRKRESEATAILREREGSLVRNACYVLLLSFDCTSAKAIRIKRVSAFAICLVHLEFGTIQLALSLELELPLSPSLSLSLVLPMLLTSHEWRERPLFETRSTRF